MSELILGPLIGGLSHNRCHLWGRADGQAVLHAWLGYQPDLSDAWLASESLPLTEETGFAGVAPLHDLEANRRYYYALTLEPVTPVPSKSQSALESGFNSFITFPQPDDRQPFSFMFGSCFLPKNESADKIFSSIDSYHKRNPLRFMLMIGDQIYADAHDHNGLGKVATTLEDYRAVYRHNWSFPALRKLLAKVPVFMILDDHEVDDDWRWRDIDHLHASIPWWVRLERWLRSAPAEERTLNISRVQVALQAYWEHQAMHAPPAELPLLINLDGRYTLQAADPGSLAYSFAYGGAAFFVLDGRSMRIVGSRERSIMSSGQWQVLENWLLSVKDEYPIKFLVSSSSVLMNLWLDIPRDRWSGFPRDRSRLISFLTENAIQGVYFLTGDLHAAHVIQIVLESSNRREIPVWEFCSSPFEQDTNRLVHLLGKPLRSGPVKRSACPIRVNKPNFGIVHVAYSEEGTPSVIFELYGADGEKLASTGE